MLKMIYYLLVAYLVYKIVRFLGRDRGAGRSASPPRPLSGRMVKDEVCQTYLPEEEAIREVVEGETHWFCGQACRTKFLEDMKRKD